MPVIDSASINRILITRMKFIGDVVLTTPIIHAICESYPSAYIAYLGEKNAVSLLEHNPYLNEIIPFDFSKPTIYEQIRVLRELRKRKFDVFIDLFSNPRTTMLAWLSSAPIRIGKEVKWRGKFYTHRILDDGRAKTAIEFHYQYVEALGVKRTHWRTEIFLTEDERREARIFLKWQNVQLDKPIIGIHPGATWPAKMWLGDRFAELISMLVRELGVQVVLTQGPEDKQLVEEVARDSGVKVTVLGVLPLRQLAAVLSHCAVYVANDSGPMHIAVAVGTKTIGIFGPGEENIWFPYVPPYYDASVAHIALRKNVPCHPCHLDFCNREGDGYMECMKLLSVLEVFEEIKKRLEDG